MYHVLKTTLLVLASTNITFAIQCSENQTERRNAYGDHICCFNTTCKPGSNQLPEPCLFHGGNDTCVDCPGDTCNAVEVNSLNMFDFSFLCKRPDKLCDTSTGGGTKVWRDNVTCEVKCKCKRILGFYLFNNKTMDCTPSNTICDDKSTWLNDKGYCEPCPNGTMQDDEIGECFPITDKTVSFTTAVPTSVGTTETAATTITFITVTPDGHRGDKTLKLTVGLSVGAVLALVVIIIVAGVVRRIIGRRQRHPRRAAEEDLRLRPLIRVEQPLMNEEIEVELPNGNNVPNGMAAGGQIRQDNVAPQSSHSN